MRFPWIASKYVSLMNNLQSSWGVWDIATQKQGGRLFDQWFKAGLVTEMAQTFILEGWLPIKSQLDMKLRLKTEFVIYTKQTLRQIVFAFKFLKITNAKVFVRALEAINHCQTDWAFQNWKIIQNLSIKLRTLCFSPGKKKMLKEIFWFIPYPDCSKFANDGHNISFILVSFIPVNWLPIKSQLDIKLRLETAFVIYTKQTSQQIAFAFKFLKISNPKVLLKTLEAINHCQTD